MPRVTAFLALLAAALCWGAGNVANKTVLDHLGPLTVVGLRCLLATMVMAPFALRELRANRDGTWLLSTIRVSLLFAAALILQQFAYVSTSVTNASFLVNTATIMTPAFAWLAFGVRPGPVIVCAAPMTFVGALLMARASFAPNFLNVGDLFCLASAAAYAAWMVALGAHAMTHGRPLATTVMQFATTAILVLPAAVLTEPLVPNALSKAWPDLLVLGVVSTAVAFGLMTWAQRYVEASMASILTSAESLFGAAGGYLLLNERTPAVGIVGAGLILAAIVMVALDDKPAVVPDRSPRKPVTPHPLILTAQEKAVLPVPQAAGFGMPPPLHLPPPTYNRTTSQSQFHHK